MEQVFAAARHAESTAEEYLVDDGWQVPEPEPVVLNASPGGTASEELEPGSCGSDDEAQRTLFSWAEFMAEAPAVSPVCVGVSAFKPPSTQRRWHRRDAGIVCLADALK